MALQRPVTLVYSSFRWPQCRKRHQVFILQLLLLSITTRSALSNPVSSPEIISQSTNKASNNIANSANGQQQQQQLHQQQQQAAKSNSQEQQLNQLNSLNSLSAYAAGNYDALVDINFKPSFKLPDMETNFTPIQSSATIIGAPPNLAEMGAGPNATPVIMQYLPGQSLQEAGVQYLQLIPTRPLILPISPFVAAQAPAPVSPYHQALTTANALAEYAPRQTTVLAPLHANNPVQPTTSTLVNVPGGGHHLPYSMHTLAAPYRTGYRFNREAKEKNLPPGLTLNMNEYMPGPSDHLTHHIYTRGRP